MHQHQEVVTRVAGKAGCVTPCNQKLPASLCHHKPNMSSNPEMLLNPPMQGFKTMLCVPGDQHRPLYLIHTGAVAILDQVPDPDQIVDRA